MTSSRNYFRALPLPACFTTKYSPVEASLLVKHRTFAKEGSTLYEGGHVSDVDYNNISDCLRSCYFRGNVVSRSSIGEYQCNTCVCLSTILFKMRNEFERSFSFLRLAATCSKIARASVKVIPTNLLPLVLLRPQRRIFQGTSFEQTACQFTSLAEMTGERELLQLCKCCFE